MSSLNISWKEKRQIRVAEVIENGFMKKKKAMKKIKLVEVEKRFLLRRYQIPKRIKLNMTLQKNLNSCTCH